MKSNGYKKYLLNQKKRKYLIRTTQLLILIFLIFLWQFLANHNLINTFITSSPKQILDTIIHLYQANNLFHHIWITTYETLISFNLGTLIGIIIAIILWYNNFIYKVIDHYLTILNSLPKVSLGPILIIWVGANINSIIAMSLLISVIITIITVYNVFISTDQKKIKLLKSFNSNKFQILKFLILPSNYPTIISSLKINISMSLIGLLPPVGENILSNKYCSKY